MRKITTNRLMNFEAIRIISMLFVVMMHVLGHGKILEECKFGTTAFYIFWFIRIAAYPCVNCFVLLSGYFMINSHVNISKIVRLDLQVIFFSIICNIIALFFGENVSFIDWIHAITPFASGNYWYVTSYIMLMIMSPFLNAAINRFNRKQHFKIIVIFLIVTCIIPTFLYWSRNYISMGRDLVWFITLYVIASYISKYNISLNKYYSFIGYILSICILIISMVFVGLLTNRILGYPKKVDILINNNSIFMLAESVFLFLLFKEIKLRSCFLKKVIAIFSPLSFGVYLFHENYVLRSRLWDLLKPNQFLNSYFGIIKTILFLLFLVILIFLVGCGLEFARRKLLGKINKKIEEMAVVIEKKIIDGLVEKNESFKTK